MLAGLPEELRQHIFSYCRVSDMKRLACCSHDYNTVVKPVLSHTVAIPCNAVTDTTLTEDARLPGVQLIRSLSFSVDSSYPYHYDGAISRLVLDSEDSVTRNNFESLVMKLNRLTELLVDHFVVDDFVFRTICANLGTHLLSLFIVRGRVSDEGLSEAVRLQQLKILHLRSLEGLSNTGFSHICGITSLKRLAINGTSKVTDISALRKLVHLQRLSARVLHHVNEDEFRHIGALVNLKEFHIVGPRIPDAGLVHLSNLTKLEVLVIHNAHGRHMLHERLAPLYSLVSLKKLDVSRCVMMSDIGIEGLVNLVNLEKLNLFGCRLVSNAGVGRLAALTLLKELNIGACPSIDDEGMKSLGRLQKLEVLNINYCLNVTDVGISTISRTLSNLKELHISFIPRITDVGIKSLQQLEKLERLYFSGSGISGTLTQLGFSYIGAITSLKAVVLVDHYNVTDDCIQHLSALNQLETLNLMHCVKMTDKSLTYLCSMRNLRDLDVTGCVNLTVDGLQCLRVLTSLETIDVSRIPNLACTQLPLSSSVKVRRPLPQTPSLNVSYRSLPNLPTRLGIALGRKLS